LWRHITAEMKAYLLATFVLVFAYICFYARYTVWSGNFAWGDRYVSSAAELAAFISVPIMLKYHAEIGRLVLLSGVVLVVLSFVIQLASLVFWMPLEIYQSDDFGHPRFVIWLRFKNIVAFALGKMDAWGLKTESMGYDHWDYQHITAWNFLPFLLQRIGEAPRWMVNSALTIWYVAIAALLSTLVKLRRALSREVIVA